jgi:hypothetical protein
MKTFFNIFFLILLSQISFGQQSSNLVIFAEDATPFYAIVNGVKQNSQPETNVKIIGLTNQANQVKVIFKDQTMPTLDKQVYFQEMNVEATMKIANTKKGYKIRYFGEVSMGAAVEDPGQNVINYNTSNDLGESATNTTVINETVTTSSQPIKGDNINMNVNVNGVGVNIDVNSTSVHTNNTSMTSTNTTTTNLGREDVDMEMYPDSQIVYVANYAGNYGCTIPTQSLNNIKTAVNNEAFSDDKMIVAKQATQNKCLTADQVTEIANLFDFEDDKLEYAKFAYAYTYDIDNYYKVNSIFNFSSSKSALNEFISKR